MLIHKVANLNLPTLDGKIVAAFPKRDYVLVITEYGSVYKLVFDYNEQWEF
jgi:hypothetical protein